MKAFDRFSHIVDSYYWPNVRTKAFITLLVGVGMCCSIYASISCRWQVFPTTNDPTNFWTFLPDDTSSVYSIGLFRYQPMAEEGMEQWDVQCVQYPSLVVGTSYWFSVPQIFAVLHLLMILAAFLFGLISTHRRAVIFFLVFAWAMQMLSVIASMGWCDEGTLKCPLQVGFFCNAMAACLYTLAFVLAWFLKEKKAEPEDNNDDDDEDSCSSTNAHEETRSKICLDDAPLDVSESNTDEETGNRVLTAEELLGMDDPVTMNFVHFHAQMTRQLKSFVRKKGQCPDDNNVNDFADDEASGGSRS